MNEIELQERVEKKMKTNPIQHKEIINMLSTEPKPVHEQNIVPVNPPVVTQYITSVTICIFISTIKYRSLMRKFRTSKEISDSRLRRKAISKTLPLLN